MKAVFCLLLPWLLLVSVVSDRSAELTWNLGSFLTQYVRHQGFRGCHILHSQNKNASKAWERWWSIGSRQYLKNQNGAYVSIGSPDGDRNMMEKEDRAACTGGCVDYPVVFVVPLFSVQDLMWFAKSQPILDESNVFFFSFETFCKIAKTMRRRELRSRRWIAFCPSPCWPELNTVYFPLNNRAIVAEIATTRPNVDITLWDVYQPAEDLPKRTTEVGRWSYASLNGSSVGRLIGPVGEPWQRRTNLTGLLVKCSTLQGPPHTYLKDSPDGSVKISGLYGDLWDILIHLLNFTTPYFFRVRCERPSDKGWGIFHNGSWTGMIGDLEREEADIAIAPLDITFSRSLAVDYTFPLSMEGYVIVIKRPTESSSKWKNYLREFTPASWIAVCVLLVLLTLSLVVVMKYAPRETTITLNDAVMVVSALIAQMGPAMKFDSLASRMLFMTIFLACFLVYNFYSSFLVSALTVRKTSLPFNDLSELYEKKSYTFGFSGGGSLEDFFKTSTQPFYRAVWEEMIVKNPASLTSGLDLVQTTRHAYMVNEDLQRMSESGILAMLHKKWITSKDDCQSPGMQAMDFSSVMTAFLLLSIGVFSAILILLVEFYVHKRDLNRR
ncbi:glutamate receptor U1-like [Penaeus japonicus]|uniref:glutamate receptor U1-like n=1 Tax=Penaeus japonicus TaxID=27405 RepID=UPI001C70D33C|nr:glutamate receptor U1-like [Penaeus japonicus]